MTFDYPLRMQVEFITFNDSLRELAPEVSTALRGLREAADAHGPLDAKQRELTLLTGFAATRNEGGFRVHCTRASQAGASLREIQQVVILLLGTCLGLVPVVEALAWLHDELT